MLPQCMPDCMASVSPCGAACGRWGTGAFPALQNPAMSGTSHKNVAEPNANGQTWTYLPSVVAVTADPLRTRKPFIHAVVAVPSVVAVQNTTTRSPSPADERLKVSDSVARGLSSSPAVMVALSDWTRQSVKPRRRPQPRPLVSLHLHPPIGTPTGTSRPGNSTPALAPVPKLGKSPVFGPESRLLSGAICCNDAGVANARPGNKPGNKIESKNQKPSIHAGFKTSFN